MAKTYTKEELFDEIVRVMGDLFEVDTEGVTRESRLVEDLDLDSIDAVDMIVHLQNMIGKRIKPEAFKSVRTSSTTSRSRTAKPPSKRRA